MSRFIRERLVVAGAARFGGALLPMLLVAAAVFAVASPWGARAIRALDPVIDARRGVGRSLSVYEPSRMEVVEGVIGMLGLGRRDVLVDIGSGDGRLVVARRARGGRGHRHRPAGAARRARAATTPAMAGVADRARRSCTPTRSTVPSIVVARRRSSRCS